jgi:hypothetical protein
VEPLHASMFMVVQRFAATSACSCTCTVHARWIRLGATYMAFPGGFVLWSEASTPRVHPSVTAW